VPQLSRLPGWLHDLAAALAAGLVWFTVITIMENGDYWYPHSPGSYRVAGAWIVVTLALRRVVPGPLFWATAVLYPVTLPWAMQTPFELLPLLVAGFAATRSGAVPWGLVGVAGGLSAFAMQLVGRPNLALPRAGPLWIGLGRSPSDVLLALALVLGAVAAGYFFRRLALASDELRERNAELQELQAERAERAVLAERTRIARELHDVVAHHMAAIVVRAQAADRVAASRPEAPAEAVRWIRDEGKQALTAMRSVVQVLRRDADGDGDAAGRAPTPVAASTPDELRAAARRLRAAGRAVDLALPEPWRAASAESGLAVVRIVQEALTNVLLHSLAQGVSVSLSDDDADLRLRVHDPGPALPGDDTRQGIGLATMRERARAAGGELSAGPDGRGGWTVAARIPREAA